jgi:signal transduction histidine kinase
VAVILTLLSALTIVRPLGRLQRRAGEILDRRGRLTGGFEVTHRRDEIGDLERALASLTGRLAAHLKASEHLTADLAHEFRNPLAAIRAATEVAMDEPDADERTTPAGARVATTSTAWSGC